LKDKLLETFPALRERNFRLYFYGQIISLAGTYLQSTAQGWLVLQLTHSAFWVGFVGAMVFFPTFILVLFGGTIVDEFDRRKLLYITQSSAMLLAFILGALTLTHHINVLEISILSFLLGVVNAIDTPARSAFIPDMVLHRENLSSAISLNTGLVTSAQAIAPAIAGILIVLIGVGGTFIINGFTFIAVLIALYLMSEVAVKRSPQTKDPIMLLRQGFGYLFEIKGLVFLIIFSFFISIFGRSFSTIFPVVATQFYHGDSKTLGWLLSASGIGAACSGVFLSYYIGRTRTKYLIIAGTVLTGLALFIFPVHRTLEWGAFCISMAGFGFGVSITSVINVFQHVSASEIRGRILSIFYFVFFGGYALGNFAAGVFSQKYGSGAVISFSGLALLIVSAIMFAMQHKIMEIV